MVYPKAMGARHPASVQRIQVLPVYLEAILKILVPLFTFFYSKTFSNFAICKCTLQKVGPHLSLKLYKLPLITQHF